MISVKEYGELLTEIDEIVENNLMDSYIKVGHIQRLIRKFRKNHVALVIPSIKAIVANAYNLTPDSLSIVTRTDTIKEARQMAMWFYYHYTKLSFKMIGAEFDNGEHRFSHCAALFSVGKIDDLCDTDKVLQKTREIITKDIQIYYTKVERKKLERVFTIEN